MFVNFPACGTDELMHVRNHMKTSIKLMFYIDSMFRLCYYPHELDKFTSMLDEAFDNKAEHSIYADFKPLDQVENPAYYIHVMRKPLN